MFTKSAALTGSKMIPDSQVVIKWATPTSTTFSYRRKKARDSLIKTLSRKVFNSQASATFQRRTMKSSLSAVIRTSGTSAKISQYASMQENKSLKSTFLLVAKSSSQVLEKKVVQVQYKYGRQIRSRRLLKSWHTAEKLKECG